MKFKGTTMEDAGEILLIILEMILTSAKKRKDKNNKVDALQDEGSKSDQELYEAYIKQK